VDAGRAAEIVSEWEEQMTSLENLTIDKVVLTNKSYTSEAAQILKDFFLSSGVAGTTKVADLSDIIASRMEDEGLEVLKTICDAFENAFLEEVDLSDNAMGSKGVSACASVLSAQAPTLRKLSLCNNGLSDTSMKEVAEVLCRPNEGNEHPTIAHGLTKIHFYNNMSGDGGCTAFAEILSNSSRLEDVRFSGTRAGRPGSVRVAEAMDALGPMGVGNVSRWDLADNTFGVDGGAALAKALARCPKLVYLNLRDCTLEDEGTISVCKALVESGCPLQHLDLSGNEITSKGAKAVASILKSFSSTLTVLFMEENEMTSRGVAAIADAISACDMSALQEVKLGMNECGNIGGRAIVAAAPKMSCLKKIELDANMFSEEVVELLHDAYGELLVEMEDNDDEEDPDEDLEEEDEEDVDELTSALDGVKI